MRPMKDRGIREIRAALARARKLQAMGRIDAHDAARLIHHLQEAEEITMRMTEYDEDGEEVEDA